MLVEQVAVLHDALAAVDDVEQPRNLDVTSSAPDTLFPALASL